MNPETKTTILSLLDFERQHITYPGVTRISEAGIVKDIYSEEKIAEIAYSANSENDIDEVIQRQIQIAKSENLDLEWKLYGHDQPQCLGERLIAAGFKADDREAFLVITPNEDSVARFGPCDADIRRVTDDKGLRDYHLVRERGWGGSDYTSEIEGHRRMLEGHPDNISLYVAYVDDEPAACGRTYFHEQSQFAGLYGGQTRARFRNRGLFTQIVATRLREAMERGVSYVSVDALPTSEPILRKRGFEYVTWTQPFILKA